MTSGEGLVIEAVLAEYLDTADRQGRTPTVAGLAAKSGLKRPTFYARYPDAVAAIAEHKQRLARHHPDRQQERVTRLTEQVAVARRAELEVGRQNKLLANQVRRLTIENARLVEELQRAAGVPNLRPKR